MGRRRAIFLDRDGVINELVFRDGKLSAPWSVGEFVILPGVAEATKRIRQRGFMCIVVSNQPDIESGKVSAEAIEQMSALMREKLAVDDVLVCPHNGSNPCDCRKPQPGMLLKAARKFDLDLAGSFVVGDRGWDIESGKAAGCMTIHIASAAAKLTDKHFAPDYAVADLAHAVEIIVGLEKSATL